jgi:MOB kinase activator 1
MKVSKMMSRIFRIYAHIMHEHFKQIKLIGQDKQLNMTFKHFFAFCYNFELLKTGFS